MTLDAATVRAAAQGRWHSVILPALGIEVSNNPRKHGPCPTCGGRDRFRFDDREGRGSWFCNQCTPQAGDGFRLLMNVRGCSFPEVVQLVAGVLGLDSSARGRRPPPKPLKIDRAALAFKWELAALDLRVRADNVMKAVKNSTINELPDLDLDRLVDAVGRAYADIERADLFEHVADGLRAKAFSQKNEGMVTHAA